MSGTTIIAVNDAGDIVATDDTAGKTPDVNGNFPFTLTGIPVGTNVRVYLLTGGGIYPMYFDSNGDGTPDINSFSLSSTSDIALGFVDTAVVGQAGKAIPQNNPTDLGAGAGTEITDIPPALITPPTAGLTCNQLLDKGFAALNTELFLQAKGHFEAAVGKCTTAGDLDTANFFYAMTRESMGSGPEISLSINSLLL